MTTVAYRDGIMAADSMMCRGDEPSYGVTKIFEVGPVLVGFSGSISNAPQFINVLKRYLTQFEQDSVDGLWAVWEEMPSYGGGFDAIIVNHAGKIWSVADAPPVRLYTDFEAIGSGAPYAMGAMRHGATAKEAVNISIGLDTNSGGDIKWLGLPRNIK